MKKQEFFGSLQPTVEYATFIYEGCGIIMSKADMHLEGNACYIADRHSKGFPVFIADGRGDIFALFPDGREIQTHGSAYQEVREDQPLPIKRVSGECICDLCGQQYYAHPNAPYLGYDDKPFLRVLCNGDLVKL